MATVKNNTEQKIKRLYAWIVTMPDGDEQVCSLQMPDGRYISLVGDNFEQVFNLSAHAVTVAKQAEQQVRLVEFIAHEVGIPTRDPSCVGRAPGSDRRASVCPGDG